MDKCIQHLNEQLSNIRNGITPGLIDSIRIPYHGQGVPLKQLARSKREEQRIIITPFDPTILHTIANTLSKEGFSSYVFSKTTVIVSIPAVQTAADRDKVENQINKIAEDAKIAVRNIRKKLRQDSSLDDKQIQKLTDEYIKKIDNIIEIKLRSINGSC